MKTFKISFILAVLLIISAMTAVTAQVTIGADNAPSSFSVLELISNNTKGLRLPQLTTAQRDTVQAHFGSKITAEAMGLQIFNTKTKCVETWNGAAWIQQCPPSGPAVPPVSPAAPVRCGITPDAGNSTTFTAKADPNAEVYEFFLGTTSQGEQTSNILTLGTAVAATSVSVAYLYPPAFLKPTMKDIPGNGGSTTWYWGTPPGTATTVSIPNFKMSETPITQVQFSAVMNGTNPAYYACGAGGASSVTTRPTSALSVENVTWYGAIAYCNKLSILEGKTPVYSVSTVSDWAALTYAQIPTAIEANWDAATCNFSANGYRLPTESEWEYAARGGTSNVHKVFSGSAYTHTGTFNDNQEAKDSLNLVGWSLNNNASSTTATTAPFYGTKPVKEKRPNVFGLYDMSGNLWEWCQDWYSGSGFPYATPTGTAVAGPASGSYRVVRGGNWNVSAAYCRVSFRNFNYPNYRYDVFGFRVVAAP